MKGSAFKARWGRASFVVCVSSKDSCLLHVSPVSLLVYPPYCCWSELCKNKSEHGLAYCKALLLPKAWFLLSAARQPGQCLSFPFSSQLFTTVSRQTALLTHPERCALSCLSNSLVMPFYSFSVWETPCFSPSIVLLAEITISCLFAELFAVHVLKLATGFSWRKWCFSLGEGDNWIGFQLCKGLAYFEGRLGAMNLALVYNKAWVSS